MNTNRLSPNISVELNVQMMREAAASQLYLSYAVLIESQGYSGISSMLFAHAEEERKHQLKILRYILNRGSVVTISAIPKPPDNPVSINDCLESIFDHEVANSNSIHELIKLCTAEGDFATIHFLDWFVNEQIEEELFAKRLLDKMKIAGGNKISNHALYTLDNDLQTEPNFLGMENGSGNGKAI